MAIKINFEKFNYSDTYELYDNGGAESLVLDDGSTEVGIDLTETVYNPQKPTFVLMTKSGVKLGIIPANDERVRGCFNAADEISFTVHKPIDSYEASDDSAEKFYTIENDAINRIWDDIIDFRLIWCREWNKVFEIYV